MNSEQFKRETIEIALVTVNETTTENPLSDNPRRKKRRKIRKSNDLVC